MALMSFLRKQESKKKVWIQQIFEIQSSIYFALCFRRNDINIFIVDIIINIF
ncbi:hypothetical protein RMAECT_0861 [Rickettsia rhipicephali str. Ect]|uniref:Uncharacterized protein n=1 Tax=Rickettsia rhipicephali str. Ect TaxID=1359199 RepID=A0A0F3PED7_RICRH|nr:hypothetical protein RMAECT_0861 [Rickettsia rhipicephali str. Ect]